MSRLRRRDRFALVGEVAIALALTLGALVLFIGGAGVFSAALAAAGWVIMVMVACIVFG